MKAQFDEFLGHLRSYGFGNRWLLVVGLLIQMAFINVGVRLGIEYAIAFWIILLIAFATWMVIAIRGSWRKLGKAAATEHKASFGDRR